MPHLPFDIKFAAIGIFAVAMCVAVAQQFLADWLGAATTRLWRWMSRRRVRVVWAPPRYRMHVASTYNVFKLGFLQGVSMPLAEVYVPLQYVQDDRRVDVYRDIQTNLRTVILGGAGAGKSVLLRHSMLSWATAPQSRDRIPVLIELTRYNRGGRDIQQLIVETLGRRENPAPSSHGRWRRHSHKAARPLVENATEFVSTALESGQLCLFLDGLDEVLTDRRADVALDIKDLAETYPTCQIVVTCREAAYDDDLSPAFDHEVRVAGFDDAGIRHFLRLWFTRSTRSAEYPTDGATFEPPAVDVRYLVEEFMAALRANPTLMRLAATPLMLTMIASLQDADTGAGPMLTESRAEFYELAIRHLLRRDAALGRHKDLARYREGHKQMALRAIALAAQGAAAAGSDQRVITEAEVYAETSRLLPRLRLSESDVPRMIDEIVDRSGLLIRVDDNNLLYEFAHLTLQEYLAAVELADAPERLLALYEQNPTRWRETVKLWCAGANRDSTTLIRKIFDGGHPGQLLALECLPEARQVDGALAGEIVDSFLARLDVVNNDQEMILAALGAVAAGTSPLGERLYADLTARAVAGGPAAGRAITVLAESRRRAAIETLSELAPRVAAARAALRSTGELAIPVLAARAAAGFSDAVDDLAVIGTPAAAVAMADQLWGEPAVAIRAAWRLATMLEAPDIESELRHVEPVPQQGTEWLTWLWQPFLFGRPSNSYVAVTIGRVGWLITHSTEADVPDDLVSIDPRLALGLGAQPGTFGTVPRRLSPELSQRLDETGERIAVERQRISGTRPWQGRLEPDKVLFQAITFEPDQAREIAVEVIATQSGRNWLPRRLLPLLPDSLVFDLAMGFLAGKPFHGENRDWLTVSEQPGQPRVLAVLNVGALSLSGVLVGALIVVAVLHSFLRLVRGRGDGLSWGLAVVMLIMIVTIIFVGWVEDHLTHKELTDVTELVGGMSVLGAILLGLVIGVPITAGRLGWPVLIAVIALTFGVTATLALLTGRRRRALRNPYRTALQSHPRTGDFGATLIGRSALPEEPGGKAATLRGR